MNHTDQEHDEADGRLPPGDGTDDDRPTDGLDAPLGMLRAQLVEAALELYTDTKAPRLRQP